jgi:hypothetical protein
VRADDPLAFGADRLRVAHATFQDDIRRLAASLPPDRRDALARARADLGSQEHKRRALKRELAQAPSTVAEAARRRWGRRDRSGIDRARARLDALRSDLARTVDVVARCRQNVIEERQAVAAWSAAMRATADQRAHLTTALTDIGDALDISRAERVAAATRDSGNELWRTLGPPPATRRGLAAWCGIAERIEAWHDQHPDTRLPDHHAPGADDLLDLRLRLHLADRRHGIAGLVERAPAIIDRASQQDLSPRPAPLEDRAIWQQAVDAADRALAVEQATRSVERGLGIDL